MGLIFNLASIAKLSGKPEAAIDRFEVWEKIVFVVFSKGHGRPTFLSVQAFYNSFVNDRKARSSTIKVTPNAFADRVFTARNPNGNAYTVIVSDAIECQCRDYREQINFLGRGMCKHGYATLRHLGFSSLIEWQTIEKLRRYPAPSDWPTFTPRSRPTQINGRSID